MQNPSTLTFNSKMYVSQMAYETNMFYGLLSRLYYKASEVTQEETTLISELVDKIKATHIETSPVRAVAKAMKNCFTKGLEYNYENLSRVREFKDMYKDKDSFLSVLAFQLIPTVTDVRFYIDAIERKDANPTVPILDLVLSNDIEKTNPEFSNLVESVKKSVGTNADGRFLTTAEIIADYEIAEKKRETGEGFFTCGFRSIDKHLTEGFAPGKLTIVAGRPAMGKSALAINFMKNLATQRIHTAQFVLEMDKISFMDRMISCMGMIELDKLVKNREIMTPSERATVQMMKEKLANNPYLHLNDKPSPDLSTIRKMIIDLQNKIGEKYIVVVIDLVDKIKNLLSGSDNMAGSFHLVLNSLQALAKELQIHLILVAQINRESEKKSDKRPSLINLKHSGAFEEVADLILFVDRPSYRMLEEDTADIDTVYDRVDLTNTFDFETVEHYKKKRDKAKAGSGEEAMIFDDLKEDHVSEPEGSKKEKATTFVKNLKEDKMMQVGNIVIPIDQYAEVILAKQRQGTPNKIIPFIFKGPFSSFTSMTLVNTYEE